MHLSLCQKHKLTAANVENNLYEEPSGKWGSKNKDRERTEEKWLKKSWKKSEKFENLKIQVRKEKNHLHKRREKGE